MTEDHMMLLRSPSSCSTSVALALGLLLPAPVRAQADSGTPVVTAQTYTLRSTALGEPRAVEVSLPAGYDGGSTRYPVLYVLDGETTSTPAAAVARFYAATGKLPPVIVVGIRNTARTRDFTTAAAPGFQLPREAQDAGGADRFLRFVAEELAPWVEGRYRTAPMRVLVGHSLGGLLAVHALAARPGYFTGYLIMEPATWWNSGQEWRAAREALQQPAGRRTRLMLINTEAIGADTTGMGGDAPMVRYLRVAGESHASMVLAGLMQGLRTLFADFPPPRWVPGTRPVTLLNHYQTLSRRLGYPVPVPPIAYEQVIRMSIHARLFQDAVLTLDRLERELGQSAGSRDLRQLLAEERSAPPPPGLVPLEIPARRPSPAEAGRFLGSWSVMGTGAGHTVEICASGDTVVVHERVQLPNGEWDEDDVPVIGLTADGGFEWGQRVFRGIAALLVLRGRIEADGSMTVTRQVRGWVPRGPTGDMLRVERFRRVPQR